MASVFAGAAGVAGVGAAGVVPVGAEVEASPVVVGLASSSFGFFDFRLKMLLRVFFMVSIASGAVIRSDVVR